MPEQDTAPATTEGTDTTTSTPTETTNAPTDARVDLNFEAPKPVLETVSEPVQPTEGTTPDADEGAPGTDAAPVEKTEAKQEPEAQKTEPEPESSEPEFDDTLLREARQRGFSDEQAKAFGQPDRLRDAMTAMDRQLMGAMNAPQIAGQPPPAQAPIAQVTPQPHPATMEAPSEFKVHLDPENFDAEIIDQFNKMNAYYQGHVTNMQRALGELIGQVQGESALGKVQRFDGYVSALGAEYEPLLGTGTVDEIDPNSTMYANRGKVFLAMDSLRQGYLQNNQRVPGERELFRRAVRMELGDQTASLERKKLNGEVEKRRKQVTQRPTQRKSKAATPKQEAVEAVKAIVRDRNIQM